LGPPPDGFRQDFGRIGFLQKSRRPLASETLDGDIPTGITMPADAEAGDALPILADTQVRTAKECQ
jgi:hypothetical protein